MYIFTKILLCTAKLFVSGAIASLIPALLLSSSDAASLSPTVAFLLMTLSLLLFVFIFRRHSVHLYDEAYTTAEFVVPTLVSYAIYALVAATLYALRISSVYNWFFMPTRFLEPVSFSPVVSFIVAHIISLVSVLIIPKHS